MRASDKIKEKMKQWEGLRLAAYRCAAGVWTIGYGHTGADVRQGMVINPAIAADLFERDLARFERGLNGLLTENNVELTQGQYDALLSFAYNVGLEALKGSTLWRKVRANPQDASIADEFGRWVYAKGVKLPGLVNRRAGEARIWENSL